MLSATQREIISTLMNQRQNAPREDIAIVPANPALIDIPARYRNATLESSPHTSALAAVRTYLRASGTGCLILSGSPGCGKTYAACAALLTSAFRSKRFAFFPAVCDRLIAFATREETSRTLSEVRFLVLDDFGSGAYPLSSTGWSDTTIAGMFDAILTHREANALPTILTTNLSGVQLSERLSDRLKSRLNGSWATLSVVNGPDLRQSPHVP